MTTHIAVSLGQLINTDFNRTLDGFAKKAVEIETKKGVFLQDASIFLKTADGKINIKPEILQKFLQDIVATFRVNGFFKLEDLPFDPSRSPEQAQQEINEKNKEIFRNKTRELLGVSVTDLPDAEFDNLWCQMCVVEPGHADRIKELLAYPHTIFHSGTNAIQAEYIIGELKNLGIEIPPEQLFLSYEQGCEYKRIEGKTNLIHKIYNFLDLQAGDKVLLIQGSTDKIPPVFQPVAVERYDDSAKTATALWVGTTVVSWNNNAKDNQEKPISLIRYLRNNNLLKEPDLSLYPSLEDNFNQLDPSIKGALTFSTIKAQLTWAFNETEQKRAIHRLHCLIDFLSANNNEYIQKLSPAEKQALIVLSLLDGCKNSAESVESFEKRGFKALKDAVPSFFKMMQEAPELFPAYNALNEEAKAAIKDKFFYLHLRHLQLGEVPISSVPQETWQKPRELMIAFWSINAAGFSIDTPQYPLGQTTIPTISPEQDQQFKSLIQAIDENNLTGYYAKQSIFSKRADLSNQFTENEIEFICRLGKMLAFIHLTEADEDYVTFIEQSAPLIKEVAAEEANVFTLHQLQAVTFLPAVLKELQKVMADKPLSEILSVFLALQKQLYLSVPSFIDTVGENRTLPLFGLSKNPNGILQNFAHAADKSQFHFEGAMNDFINIELKNGPVLPAIAFFVSSTGDTDLALATLAKLHQQNPRTPLFLIPLTDTAIKKTEQVASYVKRKPIDEITFTSAIQYQNRNKLFTLDPAFVDQFVRKYAIQHAYIGVPSPIDEEQAFQVANKLSIPCTLVYEFMFKPEKHALWDYLPQFKQKTNINFAVPLPAAAEDIRALSPEAHIEAIGHLSIDSALANTVSMNVADVKNSLAVKSNEALGFISGTTQPTNVDVNFITALLDELNTGKYPNLQVRFGIHPGVKDADTYLEALLTTCDRYSHTSSQFKIILTSTFETRLVNKPAQNDPFILRCNVSGAEASQAADKVAQAVPGALLNKAALQGKPSYFHAQEAKPYLPKTLFSPTIADFLKEKNKEPQTRETLQLKKEDAPTCLARISQAYTAK